MSLSQYQSTFGDFATWQDRWCLTADNVPKEFHIELSNERKAEIKQLKDHIDEMEDSVLDANESFTLQQQSNCLWFKGEPMCDAETGDEITMDTYVKYVKSFHGPPTKKSCAEIENVKLKIELAKLKAENEKLRSADISGACDSESDEEVACDFCDKPRKHLVKRDAGYDEWTCEECYKEQYAEEVKEVAVGEGDVGWEKY
tara:strand:- start:17319 stop:17921 length:603 start_codon:yes stop_codon:yes gene_type:complete